MPERIRALFSNIPADRERLQLMLVDAGLFEHRTATKHAALTTAALGALPFITRELCSAVSCFERGTDAVLQATQIREDGVGVDGSGHTLSTA